MLAPHLARLTEAFPAVLVTAAIFGVLHIGGHGPLFVGPMFLGAILGWARLRSRGLAAPITVVRHEERDPVREGCWPSSRPKRIW